jgi:cation transport ATPase
MDFNYSWNDIPVILFYNLNPSWIQQDIQDYLTSRNMLTESLAGVGHLVQLSRANYRKMVQNLLWAAGYNVVAIPLAAGALYAWGVLLTPAMGAALMAAGTVIVAINARLLKIKRLQSN